jgi:hypothetical protein
MKAHLVRIMELKNSMRLALMEAETILDLVQFREDDGESVGPELERAKLHVAKRRAYLAELEIQIQQARVARLL